MKKRKVAKYTTRTKELVPFDRRKIDFTKFTPDLSPKDLATLLPDQVRIATDLAAFFGTIETLGVTKTVGKGRTNLTFIEPSIVQTDATVPSATFDRTVSPHRNPAIQMHFEPGAYGITSVSSYVMVFTIEAFGSCTFTLAGLFGKLANPGTRVVNGKTAVTLVFRNVAPSDHVFGFLEQSAGSRWNFLSVSAQFPPLVISQI